MTEVVLASCSGGIVNLTLIEDLRGDTVRGDAKELADIALFEDRAGVRPTKTQYDADFEAAFATGRSLWSAHADELQEGMDPSRLRERLLGPFLSLLGYDLQYQRSHLSAGEESFRITHLGWDGGDAPPMILDPLPPDSRGERQRRSAHDEMQAYLNESPRHTWGIVSDGRVLRIVRDFHHTRTKGYVEFELAHIFEAGSVAELPGTLPGLSQFPIFGAAGTPCRGWQRTPKSPRSVTTGAAVPPLDISWRGSGEAPTASGSKSHRTPGQRCFGVQSGTTATSARRSRIRTRAVRRATHSAVSHPLPSLRGAAGDAPRQPTLRSYLLNDQTPKDRGDQPNGRSPLRPLGGTEGHVLGVPRRDSCRRSRRLPVQRRAVRPITYSVPRRGLYP